MKVEFTLDNAAEQFLDVELPAGAELWTVHVAGEAVKPVRAPGAKDDRHVLLQIKVLQFDLAYPKFLDQEEYCEFFQQLVCHLVRELELLQPLAIPAKWPGVWNAWICLRLRRLPSQ